MKSLLVIALLIPAFAHASTASFQEILAVFDSGAEPDTSKDSVRLARCVSSDGKTEIGAHVTIMNAEAYAGDDEEPAHGDITLSIFTTVDGNGKTLAPWPDLDDTATADAENLALDAYIAVASTKDYSPYELKKTFSEDFIDHSGHLQRYRSTPTGTWTLLITENGADMICEFGNEVVLD